MTAMRQHALLIDSSSGVRSADPAFLDVICADAAHAIRRELVRR